MNKKRNGYVNFMAIAGIVLIVSIVTIKGTAKTTAKVVVKESPTIIQKYGIITTHMAERITLRAALDGIKPIWIKNTFNTFATKIATDVSKQGIKKGHYIFYAKAPNGRWIKIPIVLNNGKVVGKTFMVTSKKQGKRLTAKGVETFMAKAPTIRKI